jgi:hypothetical protein
MGSLTANNGAPPGPNNESDKYSVKSDVSRYEVVDDAKKPYKNVVAGETSLDDSQNDIFAEALARYPNDECIDTRDENKVRRKLDFRILPVLGICYFFYYVDKTTLFVSSPFPSHQSSSHANSIPRSYAAIFGLRDDLALQGQEYSWLSSSFYFGWLVWAIPSNLLMQRSPPGYYLAFNIFMWGALLMAQAAAKNFAGLLALRILSGAFEAIADPAFMLITSMYFTRAEQPTRISIWYAFNGVGVAGGGLIGKCHSYSYQRHVADRSG